MQLDYRTALQGLVRISNDMDLEFLNQAGKNKNIGPLKYVATMFRREAIAALSELPFVDPSDTTKVRALQDAVQRYVATIQKIKATLASGDDAWSQLDVEEQAELAEIVKEGSQAGEDE